jgi:hypothetical protein
MMVGDIHGKSDGDALLKLGLSYATCSVVASRNEELLPTFDF